MRFDISFAFSLIQLEIAYEIFLEINFSLLVLQTPKKHYLVFKHGISDNLRNLIKNIFDMTVQFRLLLKKFEENLCSGWIS